MTISISNGQWLFQKKRIFFSLLYHLLHFSAFFNKPLVYTEYNQKTLVIMVVDV